MSRSLPLGRHWPLVRIWSCVTLAQAYLENSDDFRSRASDQTAALLRDSKLLTGPEVAQLRGSHPFDSFGGARSFLTLGETNGGPMLTYGGSQKDIAEAG